MNFRLDIEHKGLAKFRRIRGTDPVVVKRKADEQFVAWERQWQRQQEIVNARNLRLKTVFDRNQRKALAVEQTAEAQISTNTRPSHEPRKGKLDLFV